MVVLRERRQMMTVSPPSDKPVGTGGGGDEAGWGDRLPSDFGKLVNPISTRGVDYAHQITTRPLPPGFSELPTALLYLLELHSGKFFVTKSC